MKEGLTLGQTWKYCLAMWKWIAGQVEKEGYADVDGLKDEWLEKHSRFGRSKIQDDCFFCKWASGMGEDCLQCPGVLVSKKFSCTASTYHYEHEPIKFYHKLVELSEERKKSNKDDKSKRNTQRLKVK